jgi:outer membrane receptor protein involved in Fe transport
LQCRKLGSYPVRDGDQYPEDAGYGEINLDVGYKVNSHLKMQLSLFNLFNTRANSSAYFYASRLPGEPAGG